MKLPSSDDCSSLKAVSQLYVGPRGGKWRKTIDAASVKWQALNPLAKQEIARRHARMKEGNRLQALKNKAAVKEKPAMKKAAS